MVAGRQQALMSSRRVERRRNVGMNQRTIMTKALKMLTTRTGHEKLVMRRPVMVTIRASMIDLQGSLRCAMRVEVVGQRILMVMSMVTSMGESK